MRSAKMECSVVKAAQTCMCAMAPCQPHRTGRAQQARDVEHCRVQALVLRRQVVLVPGTNHKPRTSDLLGRKYFMARRGVVGWWNGVEQWRGVARRGVGGCRSRNGPQRAGFRTRYASDETRRSLGR